MGVVVAAAARAQCVAHSSAFQPWGLGLPLMVALLSTAALVLSYYFLWAPISRGFG